MVVVVVAAVLSGVVTVGAAGAAAFLVTSGLVALCAAVWLEEVGGA